MIAKQRIIWFVGVLILTAITWGLWWPDLIGLCPPRVNADSYECVHAFVRIGQPASFLLSGLVISFAAAIFSKHHIFKNWVIFSILYLPITMILLVMTSEVGDPLRVEFGRTLMSIWLSILYVIISVILIAYKSWKLKKPVTRFNN